MMTFRRSFTSVLLATIAGCGGGSDGSSISPPPPPPPPPPVSAPDFSGLAIEADASSADDLAILVGDETGVLYSYEKGNFAVENQVAIASASKMIFGLLIWDLIEAGELNRSDTPDQYLGFWTGMAGDARSEITLDQLMGFVSGFNEPPSNPGCISATGITLSDCVETIYTDGLDTLPGDAFYYGPEHMQVAGLMASIATSESIADLLEDRLSQPLGLTQTSYPILAGDNPRFSGEMRSSAEDVSLILSAILAGNLITDRAGYLEDRTSTVTFGNRPGGIDALDWHYGFGFWKECDDLTYTDVCDTDPTISSPGAFGFTPWIDFEHGYWGIVAIEDILIDGRAASEVSVELQQALQPLIEAELN